MNVPTVKQLLWLTGKLRNSDSLAFDWDTILKALAAEKIVDPANLIAIAATIAVETAHTFTPLREFGDDPYFIKMYWDNLKVRTQLGNLVLSDSFNYCGRGYIQITGRHNYTLLSIESSINFIDHPNLLCEPLFAARALAWYWHSKGLPALCQKAADMNKPGVPSLELMNAWKAVRIAVNGGLNGWDEFLGALSYLGALEPAPIIEIANPTSALSVVAQSAHN